MKLLVLGGTRFLSRAVAVEAVGRGHDVTCACRGVSGAVPHGATHLAWDRAEAPPAGLAGGVDAVVDVATRPSYVRSAVAALPDVHWVYVSTISVYAEASVPGGTPETLPLLDLVRTDEDPFSTPTTYGGMKVACEQAVLEGAASATVVRPGLIVGPEDPTGRFSYWPTRLADGGVVLAPGTPDDPVQVVDVRDLAAWLVDLAEKRTTGTFVATSRALPRGDFLAQVAEGVGADPSLTWVPQEFLLEQDVRPWMGDRSLPVWLPLPEYAGLMAHDVTAAHDAGLRTRPLAETARDTLAWLRATPDAATTGIGRDDEAAVLAAWHAQNGSSGSAS
ncbi:NAD-dependent epimerase/dehydratase family protein [Nocardioides sp. GCM10027113]|uniref:NAD-dependent epimerase/dehydratase family protein n=1 Tax=unclassified Nocardioides TaxID=2615069 RepID=UPI00360D271A